MGKVAVIDLALITRGPSATPLGPVSACRTRRQRRPGSVWCAVLTGQNDRHSLWRPVDAGPHTPARFFQLRAARVVLATVEIASTTRRGQLPDRDARVQVS